MSLLRPLLVLCLLFAAGAGTASSEPDEAAKADAPEAPASVRVTLDEALAAADAAPGVVVARAAALAAQQEIEVVRTPGAPSLMVGTHSVTAKESVVLSAPVRLWGQKRAALAQAEAGLETARRQGESAQREARRLLRAGWFALATAEAQARLASERAARVARGAAAIEAQESAGRASRLDASRAEAEAAVARAEESALEQERAGAAAGLAYLLGSPEGGSLGTTGDAPPPSAGAPLEDAKAAAGLHAPEVRVAEAGLAETDARLNAVRVQGYPGLTGEIGADFHDPTESGTDKFAAVTASIPLDGRARVRVATAQHDAASLALERERRLARTRAERAWRRAEGARLKFETLDRTALPAVRRAAELSRVAYREGQTDLFRLLETERVLAGTESDRWDAWRDWGEARAELLALTGEDE